MSTQLKLSIGCVLALLCMGFKGPDDPLEKLLKQLAKLTASYPQEKVHLHTDKPYYAVGEDIWFKGYVITAEKNEPSALSRILYIDLIDSKNNIRKKLTLPIENGYAKGNISLLDSLESGNYRIRSYTNYMRNFSDDFFFEKAVNIRSILDTARQKPKTEKLDISLQFFPEGGNLVNEIRSRIGLKAVSADGLGVNLSGYVMNKAKEKVAEFATTHAGMGAFALTPQKGEKYVATITFEDGRVKTFDLPMAQENGYGLAVNQANDQITLKIAATSDIAKEGKAIIVIGQSNGVVYSTFKGQLDKTVMTANIPKSNFPSGIAEFTLFTESYEPIAERLVFIDNNDALKININNKGSIAGVKKKMQYDLEVTDANNNPIDGNFSISVTNADQVKINEDDETSIFSSLLLSSDLRGYIEKPNYYFNPSNANRAEHLDNLMLTQGWRRFAWKDIIDAKEPQIAYRLEQSLEIGGKVVSLGNKPMPNAAVNLFSITPGFGLQLDTISDLQGDFVFDRLNVPDSASFLIQSKLGRNNKDIGILLNQRPRVQPVAYVGPAINLLPYVQYTKDMFLELNKYNKLDKTFLLKQVDITKKLPSKPVLAAPNSYNTSGNYDYMLPQKEIEKYESIYTVLSRVPGIYMQDFKFYKMARNSITTRKPLLLMVDGVAIDQDEDPKFLRSINTKDLLAIEVLVRNYNLSVHGSDGATGMIYFTSKTGVGKPEKATNVAKVSHIGFSAVKEFYVPDYDDPKTDQQMRDLRSTVYWNPSISTSERGKAGFNYFNTSLPGNYRVVIEGMDSYGQMGRKVYSYSVN